MYNLSHTYGWPAFSWLQFRESTRAFGCTLESDLRLDFYTFSLMIHIVCSNFTIIDSSWYADAEDNVTALKISLARL